MLTPDDPNKLSPFMRLPNEIILIIFSFMEKAEDYTHMRLGLVCKTFYCLTREPSLWVWKDLERELRVAKFEAFTAKDIELRNAEDDLIKALFLYPATIGLTILKSPRWSALIKQRLARTTSCRTPQAIGFDEGRKLFDYASLEAMTESDIKDLVEALYQVQQGVLEKNLEVIAKANKFYHKDYYKRLHSKYYDYAYFILYFPCFRFRLGIKELEKLAKISPKIAKAIITERYNLFPNLLPVFDKALGAEFFNILAASFNVDDYYYWDEFPIVIRYLRQTFEDQRIQIEHYEGQTVLTKTFIKEDDKNTNEIVRYPLEELLKLAQQDSRIALLVIGTPSLAHAFGIETLFDLAIHWMNHLEETWNWQSATRWVPDFCVLKYSPDSPMYKRHFSIPMTHVLFAVHMNKEVVAYIKSKRFIRMHTVPKEYNDGPLYEVEYVTQKRKVFRHYLKEGSHLNNCDLLSKQGRPVTGCNGVISDNSLSVPSSDLDETLRSQPLMSFDSEPSSPKPASSEAPSYYVILGWVVSILLVLFGVALLIMSGSPDYLSMQVTLELVGGVCLGLGDLLGLSLALFALPADNSLSHEPVSLTSSVPSEAGVSHHLSLAKASHYSQVFYGPVSGLSISDGDSLSCTLQKTVAHQLELGMT